MFQLSTRRDRNGATDTEHAQPLLGSRDDITNDRTIFSVQDSDDETEPTALDAAKTDRIDHGVRFQEEVQVIGLPLRSTLASREAEFDLDSDQMDEHDDANLITPPGHMDQSMPLLVGLFESSASRRSLDAVHTHESQEAAGYNLEEIAAKRIAGGSIIDSIANMANSILGAGIIGLPYAVSQAGFVSGLVLLVVLCCVTDWTIRLIVINAKLSGRHSYIEIMDHCFGSSGRAAVSFFQFAFAFGGMCAFGIIIGDTIPHVIRSIFPQLHSIPVLKIFANRQFVITLCTVCVSYPLSLYRDIQKLSRASGVALVGMLIIVTSVMVEESHVPPELKGDPSKRFSIIEPGFFQAVGVISFAFVCHHNSLLIYGSLRTPTLDRFAKVAHISTLISLVACTTLAVSAYLVFTDKTQGNILNNFAANDTLINVARFCFGLNMFTTLPLELFVCREVVEQYFFSHELFNQQRHIFFTSTILLSSMLVSLVTCDLGVMLEITGGISATALAYIFPAACYIKLIDSNTPWHSRTKLPAFMCVAFGIIVMTTSLFLALGKSWTPAGGPKICS